MCCVVLPLLIVHVFVCRQGLLNGLDLIEQMQYGCCLVLLCISTVPLQSDPKNTPVDMSFSAFLFSYVCSYV